MGSSAADDDGNRLHSARLCDVGLASRKAEEAAIRRYEAAAWLRKTVGVVGGRDLPDNPSEVEFMRGLRNGVILCNALNEVQRGSISKVVSCVGDSVLLPDGTTLSAYQYFENIRNFLVAVEEIGLPMFETSDLENGGKSARVVDCVLAMKSYNEWKESGRNGSWKLGSNIKPAKSHFSKKNSESFFSCLKNSCAGTNLDELLSHESGEMDARLLLDILVKRLLAEKSDEVLKAKKAVRDLPDGRKNSLKRRVLAELAASPYDGKTESADENFTSLEDDHVGGKLNSEEPKVLLDKRRLNLEKQQRQIQELKGMLCRARTDMQSMQMQYCKDFANIGKHLHIVARDALGYRKVLEENRTLYNQVLDLKGSIRVYCRVRPFLPGKHCHTSSIGHIGDGNISINTSTKYGKEGSKLFNFNKVFDASATQEDIFSDTQPLIRSVLDGYNVCIFAYGQTGSGKTFTMVGPNNITKENQGVNYRALNDLFYLVQQRKELFSYEITVQMIEIYNEQVRDLLSNDDVNRKLEIRNSTPNGLNVPEANFVPVASTSDVIRLIDIGQKNRAVGATAMNDRSSRSHSCLMVHVKGKEISSGIVLHGCMHLVDLAGSERVDKSEVTGERLKEAQHINKSLSALGDVIASLAQKNSHVPYRNSKLTQLLQNSLGGQAKTLMFVHISPEIDAVEETISTLKFAERVSSVELGAARLNKENSEVKELKEEISRLKEALARRNGSSEHPHTVRRSPVPSPKPSTAPHRKNGFMDHINNKQDNGIEAGSYSSTRQRKVNVLPQDILSEANSPRPETSSTECDSTQEDTKSDVSKRDSQGETLDLPEFFRDRYLKGSQPDNYQKTSGTSAHEFQRPKFESTINNDSDEVASISSEADILLRYARLDATPINLRASTTAIGLRGSSTTPISVRGSSNTPISLSGSKIKKPPSRPSRIPDLRTPVRGHVPNLSSTGKVPVGGTGSAKTPNRSSQMWNDKLRQSSNWRKENGK